jgi:predicted nucleic acid-binding protein
MLKKGRVSQAQAAACLEAYEQIPIRFVDVELQAVLKLAIPHRMWAFDAYVLQAALSLGLPLLTLDVAQSRIAQKVGVALMEKLI